MLEIRKRLLIFAAATSAVLIMLLLWRPPATGGAQPGERTAEGLLILPPQVERVERWGPSPNVIADTWFGPLLVLLIPATLAWVSLGAETRRGANVALSWTVAVTALASLAIWIGFKSAEAVVFCLTGDC